MRGGRLILVLGAIVLVAVLAVVFLMASDGGGDDGGSADGDFTPGPGDQGGEPIQAAPTQDLVQIVVAIQDLPRGIKIPEDGVGLQFWPRDALLEPENYFVADRMPEVIGQIARTDIPRGAPVLVRQVVRDLADISSTGSDAAAMMVNRPPGTVAVSIPLDPSGIGQVAFGIQDGDSVDVILSFLFVDVDPTFQTRMPNNVSLLTRVETGELSIGAPRQGRTEASPLSPEGVLLGPSEPSQRPRLVTQRTVTNAWVVHVGYFPPSGDFIGATPTSVVEPTAPPPGEGDQQAPEQQVVQPTATDYVPLIITLAVSPQEALVLTWAVDSQIPITLALRRANDESDIATNPVSLDYMISNYNAAPPNALEFALEPPITSVRRFDIATLFNFLGSELGQ